MQYPPPKRIPRVTFFIFLPILLFHFAEVRAQAPDLINFQGQLGERFAAPASVTFAIYDALEGGEKLWEETHQALPMDDGFLDVLLGSNDPFPATLFSDSGERFVDIKINGEQLTPRLQLTSVSYAIRAKTADQLLTPVVSSVNGISDEMTIEAGENIAIINNGQSITISASVNGSSGVQSISGGAGILVVNPNGPSTTVQIAANSISDALIEDGSLSRSSFADGAAVYALNGLADEVVIEGGNNIEVVQSGQTITINSNQPGQEGGISVINPGNGINVSDTNGPTTTISLSSDSITDAEIKDNSISRSSLAPGSAVFSVNGVSNDIILTGGTNVDVDQSGQTITINAESTGDGVGIATINAGTGISVSDTDGPSTTIGILSNSITDTQIADNSISQSSLSSGAAVFGLNGLTDEVTLAGGSNVDIVQSGQTLTINASSSGGGGGGIESIAGENGIVVNQPNGPNTTVGIRNNSINDNQIMNNSLTALSLAAGSVGSSELDNQIVLGADGRLEVENGSGQIRAALTTSNGGGFLGIDTSDDRDAVSIEALNGDAYGLITVHNSSGDTGVRIWGDQTGSGLTGGSLAVFKRNGNNSSTWIRTGGSSINNSWGIIGISDASNNEVIRLDGEDGDITIAGNLAKGSGSFKIDHPLDPANKYLSHSFVESPDMMNIYNGNVVLDNEGMAWVELPEWFEVLNRDFRYQLTCIGGFAQVYVAEEIVDGRFRIAGGTPGLKVSWQVTGVRQDPYAEKHRIQVEEDKPADKRGSYLHPDVYGQQ